MCVRQSLETIIVYTKGNSNRVCLIKQSAKYYIYEKKKIKLKNSTLTNEEVVVSTRISE